MDIIFSTDNKFCQHAAVAITSLLDNNRGEDITIHLFCLEVESNNRSLIESVVASFNQKIKVYNITKELFKGFPDPGVYSWACYLRVLTPSLLVGCSRALYLDCDIIVDGNIRELYDLNINKYSLAGLQDATLSNNIIKDYIGYDFVTYGYVNSGVLLLNLEYWRENNIQQKLIDHLNHNVVKLPDQDAINAVLHGTIKFLHPMWNTHVGYFAYPPLVIDEHKKYIKDLWSDAKIIHFTGPAKPWARECVHPYKHIYKRYLKVTPWRNVPSIEIEKNIFAACRIMFLRWAKNIVAKAISYSYK